MKVSIGVKEVPGEITLDVEKSADEIAGAVKTAFGGDTLDLTDSDGTRVLVPSASIGYVQIKDVPERKVGFGF
ncbi:hypothetical protein J2S49_001562 [Arcanobacterium wilhelmae]|uniref:DUF3107 domain-containing protein n=1 Tax=Arcanobacterium wilhelmae TaxID=1803177 RepID=A0ABT9NE65_9ACTO|nr:DUF3107 domain-containing protein [Arcanobacterium wilhelmae]MDP9801486.1 hypothetical protein [Arcanobacterium wilhelmae]WFN90817.1 DUF3107 domain-containing protein [Arcanobacterium wilhelmae]